MPRQLFGWGRDGVPGEVESYIKASGDGCDKRDRGFSRSGVERVAGELLAHIEAARRGAGKKEYWPRIDHETATWAWLLCAYCAKYGQPAPPALLDLIFDVIGLVDGEPAVEVSRAIHVAAGVKKINAFLDAGLLDGEADAAGVVLSAKRLAATVGVDRKTLTRWRAMSEYGRRRRMAAHAAEYWQNRADKRGARGVS